MMKSRTKKRLLLKVVCISWIIFAGIYYWTNLLLMILASGNPKQKDVLSIRNVTRTGIDVSDVSMQSKCPNVIDEQAILKKLWPPKALPGDTGYGGDGITINRSSLTDREKNIYDLGLSNYQVNQLASEMIPLRRDISLDMPECRNLTYNTATLPTAGVVLIFFDEMWTALMRTVFSILDAGPSHLITEIILVDDASERDHLRTPLEDYIKIFGGKVKIVRMPNRKGLIAARLVGFQHVTGEVAIFLDGHCEVSKGWVEPLLHRIQQDDSVIAVPNIDNLQRSTFKYTFLSNKEHRICGFSFNMKYTWIETPLPDGVKRKTFADPVETPIHMGCCLAVSKKTFERLGGYDPDLEIWGCENLELSFKAWMCGSRLEVIPCSHVAHMYRRSFPYSWGNKENIFKRNCLRVAEVWMDEYKVFYQDRVSNLQNTIDIGDVSERKAIRQKLKCRSFDWFVKEIYPSIYVPTNTTAIGRIANARMPDLCFTRGFPLTNEPVAEKCEPMKEDQYFYLTKEKQIRRDDRCVSYNTTSKQFGFPFCKDDHGTWQYSQDNTINFIGTDQCIALSSNNTRIIMTQCNGSETSQQWSWSRKSIVLQ